MYEIIFFKTLNKYSIFKSQLLCLKCIYNIKFNIICTLTIIYVQTINCMQCYWPRIFAFLRLKFIL